MEKFRNITLVLFFLASLLSINHVQAKEAPLYQVRVVADQLNVRPSPPKFTLGTIFSFEYQLSPAIDKVKKQSVLNVYEMQRVGNGAEWLRVSYSKPGHTNGSGWIYAGRSGAWTNVVKIGGQQGKIDREDNVLIAILDWLVPDANADEAVPDNEAAGTQASAPFVLMVIVINLILFLGAMFAAKKIQNDIKLIVFTGAATLLIEGVVTEKGFWGMISSLIS